MVRSPTSDERLAIEIQKGRRIEENSFELHRRWDPALTTFFRNRRFPPEECLDLTQIVWTRVFIRIEQFHGKNFKSWLFTIAKNSYTNEIRERKTQKRLATLVEIDVSDEDRCPVELVDPRPIASTRLLRREEVEALRCAIQQLPARMRHCVLLRVQGRMIREIAVLLKISQGAVKAHLHQARSRLTSELGSLFGDAGFSGRERS